MALFFFFFFCVLYDADLLFVVYLLEMALKTMLTSAWTVTIVL